MAESMKMLVRQGDRKHVPLCAIAETVYAAGIWDRVPSA